MHAKISAIEYSLPEATLTTADLAAEFPAWGVEKLDRNSGIETRHIAGPEECASDLAVAAARKLFASGACQSSEIDFVLLCTESPDYFVPATACLVQDRLGIPTTAGALDYNLAHSGYIYGLGLAEGLIASGQATRVLLLTAETYSKYIHPADRSVRTIFGDGAAATLLAAVDSERPHVGPFVYGTNGKGAQNLMVPAGGSRRPRTPETAVAVEDEHGNVRSADNLFMDGGEIFSFTLTAVPNLVRGLLAKSGRTIADVDLFVFHQANRYILEHLRKRVGIPPEKFMLALAHCGNTVSSSIPIALKEALLAGRIPEGSTVAIAGYGAGYSWGAALLRW